MVKIIKKKSSLFYVLRFLIVLFTNFTIYGVSKDSIK